MELIEAKGSGRRIVCLQVSQIEALELIASMTNQLLSQTPNVGRLEKFLKDGRDFTIAVIPAAVVK